MHLLKESRQIRPLLLKQYKYKAMIQEEDNDIKYIKANDDDEVKPRKETIEVNRCAATERPAFLKRVEPN